MKLRRPIVLAAALACVALAATAQQGTSQSSGAQSSGGTQMQMPGMAGSERHDAAKAEPPAKLFAGLGSLHHPIQTSNPEAQKFFDQGLTLVYAFNHEEAVRSFKRAAELDPHAAMPYWGIALASGPNYNSDVDPQREKASYDAIHKAMEIGVASPPNERDYIDALATRYTNDPKADLGKLANDYAAAMRDLSQRYPDDPDASTLFAESLMDLHPWMLWTNDGKPWPRHGGNCLGARGSAAKVAEPCRGKSFLHSRDGGFAAPGSSAAERATAGDDGARGRPSGPHARAHLYPHGRLRRRREKQCGRGGDR